MENPERIESKVEDSELNESKYDNVHPLRAENTFRYDGEYKYFPIGETELATINNTSVTTRVFGNDLDQVAFEISVNGFKIIVRDGELVRYRRRLYIVRRLRRNVNDDRFSMEVSGASSRTFTIHLPNGAHDFDFNVLPRNYAEEMTAAKHRKMRVAWSA